MARAQEGAPNSPEGHKMGVSKAHPLPMLRHCTIPIVLVTFGACQFLSTLFILSQLEQKFPAQQCVDRCFAIPLKDKGQLSG